MNGVADRAVAQEGSAGSRLAAPDRPWAGGAPSSGLLLVMSRRARWQGRDRDMESVPQPYHDAEPGVEAVDTIEIVLGTLYQRYGPLSCPFVELRVPGMNEILATGGDTMFPSLAQHRVSAMAIGKRMRMGIRPWWQCASKSDQRGHGPVHEICCHDDWTNDRLVAQPAGIGRCRTRPETRC